MSLELTVLFFFFWVYILQFRIFFLRILTLDFTIPFFSFLNEKRQFYICITHNSGFYSEFWVTSHNSVSVMELTSWHLAFFAQNSEFTSCKSVFVFTTESEIKKRIVLFATRVVTVWYIHGMILVSENIMVYNIKQSKQVWKHVY